METEHAPTNPLQSDSDGDGVDDLSEINQGRNPNLVELTDWTAVGTGIWNLSNGDLTVRQTENVNDLYYLAPYDVQNKSITFSMGVSGDTDNDYIGFVIGYEDSSNFYRFAWTKSESSGGGAPTDGWNLYKIENGVVSTLATDESDYTKGWEIDVDYNVTVSYSSGKLSIHLTGGTQAFANGATIATIEGEFPSGKFGFYGSSQAGMNFSSLKFEQFYTPEISLLGDSTVTVEGATSFSDPGATATDFEDGNLTSAITTSGTVNLQVVGAYQLVYTATDSSGIGVNVTRTVNVVDTTAPVITLTGDTTVTHEGATTYTDAGAGWTDTIDGSGNLTAVGNVDLNTVGSYVLSYDYTDGAGNAATQVTRTVNVVDTTLPVITLTGDATVTHEAATTYTDAGAGWTDTLDGSGDLTASGSVDVNTVGSYSLTYDYTDAAGNAAVQVTRTVNVVDTTNPVITLTGDATVTHEAATTYTDAGAGWTDTLDGSGTLTASGTVDVNTVGSYPLTYDYTDAEGNAAVQVTRTVNVVDTTNPVITLSGDATVTHEAATTYTDAGAGWTDTLDGSGSLTASGTVDVNTVGSYLLTYDFTDEAGNSATQVNRTVNVVDTTIPVITLRGDANVSHQVWTEYSDAGAEASDTLDGNLTANILTTSTVDVNQPGVYTITYQVSDAVGNQATSVTREVRVINRVPSSLHLSNSTIEENLPIGTEVGSFSTTDLDDPEDNRTYSYSMIGGSGAAVLELEGNGLLKSSAVLNFESVSSYEITVRTTDAFGGSLDHNFTIDVLDAFHSIVDTKEVGEIGTSFATLNGEVLDAGGLAGVGERGFIVSNLPEPTYGEWEAIQIRSGSGVGAFSEKVEGLNSGTVYYVSTYAVNSEGISYGSSEKFTTASVDQPLFLTDAQKLVGSEGWWTSPWLGDFYEVESNGWILHSQLGWLFSVPAPNQGVWFWKEQIGWIWTEAGVYPHFHSNDSGGWLYFYGSDSKDSLFYDHVSEDWIKIQK